MANLTLDYVNSFIDARGKLRHQFRRKGHARKTIKGRAGSEEFMERYHELLAQTGGTMVAEIGAGRIKAGSIDALVVRYMRHDSFTQGLAKATQELRVSILNRFRDFKTPEGRRYGDARLSTMPKARIEDVLQGRTSSTQRNWLITIRGLVAFGIAQKECSVDVSAGLKPTKAIKSSGHMTWKMPQVAQYRERHPLGTMARLALELMLAIAARREDAHKIGRQHMTFNADAQVNVLTWRPSKTLRSTGKSLSIPVLPFLQEALDAMPRDCGGRSTRTPAVLTFLTNDHDQPFASAGAFGNKFADWCRQAGLQPVTGDDGRIRNYRAHGLRKASLYTLFKNGGSLAELQALGGHSSVAELQKYLAEIEQEEMAISGMAKVAASQSKNRQ
jgi:integrase/recombinase XerD